MRINHQSAPALTLRVSASALLLVALVAGLTLAGGVNAQAAPATPVKPAAGSVVQAAPELEPKAMELLRAMSSNLAAAKSMAFTAVVTYESLSNLGPPLAYSTQSEVVMQRPDKLRVVTLGDGPASEFYYDGKTMTAFAPAENLVAITAAPPTLEAALKAAFDNAAIYFPFSDMLSADPYADLSEKLTSAFYIGQSKVVGGVTTDMLALASDTLFVQLWIGVDDKLPRRMRAVYRGDTARLRHQLDLSNWKLDPVIAAEAFAAVNAANAKRIEFAAPQVTTGAKKPLKANAKTH